MYRSRRREYGKRRRSRFASALTLLVVIGGLGLVAYSLLGENSPLTKAVENATSDEEVADSTPAETTLKLTVPDMERVSDVTVLDAPYDDESALDAGAQHVQDTGFPWEDEANVFIAGHRLGYFGTDSYLVFWDLDKLEDGDEVFLTDSEGTRYTYEVYENFVTGPYDWSVTEPVSGKNIVTLQTCTLPDYSERIIVHAELTEVEPGEGAAPEEDEQERDEPPQYEPEPVPVEQVPLVPGLDEPLPEEPLLEEPLLGEPLPEEPLPVEPGPAAPVQPAEPIPAGPAQPAEPLLAEPAPPAPAPIG
ncbi:MAG: Sortase A, LPXTG specific [uncultured Rubrobacteraceae bacterium]|uniref:Sortase A, LPXTG specific n=1 Tax=uncultured Rubrobacteraceae bacterium TaxID=349277 RepID=A0A6J4QQY3_9ACTN|nr:MAG: Sortase A, LPXTG specific [uncultured Rubrobacteraceae bacterium]